MALSLSARGVVKRFGGVTALMDANLDVNAGEVVALIGANGSGKSTLSKVINGVVVLDRGQLLLDGQPVNFSSPQAAKNFGISTVFQDLSLIPQMTEAEPWIRRKSPGKRMLFWICSRERIHPAFARMRRLGPCLPMKNRLLKS
jgi:ABC-type sugar transport system ATPase subunit